jgi:hypothetical protein
MGQSASKLSARLSSRIAAATSTTKQSSHSPNTITTTTLRRPDPITGFLRGQGPMDARDEQQLEFLKRQQKQNDPNHDASKPHDMPPELLQFLNDAGPLKQRNNNNSKDSKNIDKQKQVVKKRLPKIPGLDHDDNDREQQQQKQKQVSIPSSTSPHSDSTRIQQSMPLAARVQGFDTTRTSSFSHKADIDDPKDFGLDILDLYRLVVRQPNHHHQDESLKRRQSQIYKEHVQNRDTSVWTEAEKEHHLKLLQYTQQYLQVPVILKDDDDTYVGAFARDASKLQNMKLTLMPKTSVMLVMEDLIEQKERECDSVDEEDETAVIDKKPRETSAINK